MQLMHKRFVGQNLCKKKVTTKMEVHLLFVDLIVFLYTSCHKSTMGIPLNDEMTLAQDHEDHEFVSKS